MFAAHKVESERCKYTGKVEKHTVLYKTVSISNAHLKYYSKDIRLASNSKNKNRMMTGNF